MRRGDGIWRPDEDVARAEFPSRRAYGWLAVVVMAFALYVSLVPFEFKALPLGVAFDEFRRVMLSGRYERMSRTNFLANILLFVPIGFGLAGALLLGRTRRPTTVLAPIALLPISLLVSLTAEFLQVFVPGRFVSGADVTAQTIGCLAGMAGWAIAGERVTAWWGTASARHRGDWAARALFACLGAWLFVNLSPFDITFDPGSLAYRVRTGLISFQPFWNAGARPGLAWGAAAAALGALPIGALGLVGWAGPGARRRAFPAFALAAAVVLLVEVAQVFIRSHAADVNDLLFGWLGAAVGVWLGRRFASHRRVLPQ